MYQGYDMSQLLKNARVPMDAFNARKEKRVAMAKPQPTSPALAPALLPMKKEHDPIQDLIKAGDLDQNPQFVDQILKEMGLTKFWDFLMYSETHSVVRPLAVNRILNFYEGATRGGLSPSVIKTGLISAIMLSTVVSDRHNADMPYAQGPLGVMHPRVKCNLQGLDIGNIDNMIVLSAEKAVTYIAKVTRPDQNKVGVDRLGAYLLNAMRMWILSDDEELLDFMAKGGSRMQHMKESARNSSMIRQQLGNGDIGNYTTLALTDFTTPWSSGKSVSRNSARRISALRA